MNTFYFIEKKPPSKWIRFGVPILILVSAVIKFFVWDTDPNNSSLFSAFFFVVMAFFYFATFTKPHRKSYISIDETFIEFLLPGAQDITKLNWTDILRVKFEDDGVSLYQQSSFCDFISFKNLEESDKEVIKKLIEKTKL